VRNNGPIAKDWFESQANHKGWQMRWQRNFTGITAGGLGPIDDNKDLCNDGFTDLTKRIQAAIRSIPKAERTAEKILEAWERADIHKMNEIRKRVESIVAEKTPQKKQTAENLKPWYSQLCKRPCFHDKYLQAFTRDDVTLIDTDGKGVTDVTSLGLIANGREYPIDCIIFASGFEVQQASGFRVDRPTPPYPVMIGTNNIDVNDLWSKKIRTLFGMMAHHYPNAFFIQFLQGASVITNVPHNYLEMSTTIATILKHALFSENSKKMNRIEADEEAQEKWYKLLKKGVTNPIGIFNPMYLKNCTPGYYNSEGTSNPSPVIGDLIGYPNGPLEFYGFMEKWRSNGEFKGLSFSSSSPSFRQSKL